MRNSMRTKLILYFLIITTIINSCSGDLQPSPPEIVSFSPTSGIPGAEIVITGKNFNNTSSKNDVTIGDNGTPCSILEASVTRLRIKTPNDVKTGKLKITVSDQSTVSVQEFTSYDIYVSGIEGRIVKYWKNGETKELTIPSGPSSVGKMFILGDSVFVAGSSSGSAKCWGCISYLSTPACCGSYGASVFVNGMNEYVTGGSSKNGFYHAVYWLNGLMVELPDNVYSGAGDIYVTGTDVYITGDQAIGGVYWKNGVPIILSGFKPSSIFVSGSDIYMSGSSNNVAAYWKNGVTFELLDGTSASEIYLFEKDVYISGNFGKYAKYWKNGMPVTLTDGSTNASATSIFVFKSDVFVAGSDGELAKYWKNGEPIILGPGHATSILVTKN